MGAAGLGGGVAGRGVEYRNSGAVVEAVGADGVVVGHVHGVGLLIHRGPGRAGAHRHGGRVLAGTSAQVRRVAGRDVDHRHVVGGGVDHVSGVVGLVHSDRKGAAAHRDLRWGLCAPGGDLAVAGGAIDHRDGAGVGVGYVDRAGRWVGRQVRRAASHGHGRRVMPAPDRSAARQVRPLITDTVFPVPFPPGPSFAT